MQCLDKMMDGKRNLSACCGPFYIGEHLDPDRRGDVGKATLRVGGCSPVAQSCAPMLTSPGQVASVLGVFVERHSP